MSDSIDNRHSGQVCNLDYLLVNLGRNQAAALRLIHLFIDNYPQLIARLDDAAKACNVSALRDVVHDIRGSCVLFSAHQSVELARELEYVLFCHKGDGQTVNWTLKAGPLRDSLELVRAELAQYLENSSGLPDSQ